ncbi:class I SAM-dependent methyltransferase [Rubrobacter calidifluminis]|uniref:class I SAM-dependent methyltransferase n=1 Tax=Rubrobacter calidifluminis TaxID=1392640 RepID=UPI00236135FC|nr:class I SAM-dependent methyltransferase [Rubrobacter calidifluminis]
MERWNDEDSKLFMDLGRYFVPEREYQIGAICALIPVSTYEPFEVLDLCCGEGLLAEAILEAFPRCSVRGLDGSPAMLEAATKRLARFGDRFAAGEFDLTSSSWRGAYGPVRAAVSSLAFHHLDGAQKRALFRDVYHMVQPGGAFIIADLVMPVSEAGVRLAARSWDEAVRERSLKLLGDERAFERFEEERWNLYRYPDPEVDKPSALYEQLRWLDDAGFEGVDVFLMYAGHAVFGGMRP